MNSQLSSMSSGTESLQYRSATSLLLENEYHRDHRKCVVQQTKDWEDEKVI